MKGKTHQLLKQKRPARFSKFVIIWTFSPLQSVKSTLDRKLYRLQNHLGKISGGGISAQRSGREFHRLGVASSRSPFAQPGVLQSLVATKTPTLAAPHSSMCLGLPPWRLMPQPQRRGTTPPIPPSRGGRGPWELESPNTHTQAGLGRFCKFPWQKGTPFPDPAAICSRARREAGERGSGPRGCVCSRGACLRSMPRIIQLNASVCKQAGLYPVSCCHGDCL